MKIGIIDLSSSSWTAGQVFTKVVSHALVSAVQKSSGDAVVTISDRKKSLVAGLDICPPTPRPAPRFGDNIRQRFFPKPQPSVLERTMSAAGLDVALPVVYMAAGRRTTNHGAMIGWIPDFQHLHLPEFFSKDEIAKRETQSDICVQSCARVLFSSQDALGHFTQRFPKSAEKGAAIPFPSLFAFEPPAPSQESASAKFRLPAKFILVANQFWAHKNHLTVVRAAALLKQRGISIPFVFTGQIGDHRADGECTASRVLQECAALGVSDQVRILGLVSRADLFCLLREASAVLQPSRFEGWSTTIQDAKALGRPVICSDIPVHREQAPHAVLFFSPLEPEDLANKLEKSWPEISNGHLGLAEETALTHEKAFGLEYGRRLLDLCRSAHTVQP